MEKVDFDEVSKLVRYTINTYYYQLVEQIYDVDDFFMQIIDDIYIMARDSYDSKRAKLSTFICMCVHTRLPRYIRHLRPYGSYADTVSLHDLISGIDDITYQDVLKDNHNSVEYWAVINNMVDRLKLQFRAERDRNIISLLMEGYSIAQIGRILHLSRQRIKQKLDDYRDFLQRTFKITEFSF